MRIKVQKKKWQILQKVGKGTLIDVLWVFLTQGRVIDPEMVGLRSFNPGLYSESELDISGDLEDDHIFAWECYFRNNNNLVCAEFKLYFFKELYQTNGLRIVTPFRLTTFLRHSLINKIEHNSDCRFKVFLEKEMMNGCILFENGTIFHFSTGRKKSKRNFFITSIESNYDESGLHDMKMINERHAKNLYHECSRKSISFKKMALSTPAKKLFLFIENNLQNSWIGYCQES